MPAFPNRVQDAPSEELPEMPFRGPFGGWQSELPLDSIEGLGFATISNLILRKGAATVRPGWTGLTAMPDPQEPINGIADFFDATGVRHQVIMTPTRLLAWNGSSLTWTVISGTLTGPSNALFDWTVVANKLLFSQGTDPVQLWDGIAGTFAPAAAAAVPANYMMELGGQLIVANTIEGGSPFPQRWRWTKPGDPTDWTSLNAGVADLANDLGPINHAVKLYQSGYFIQYFGVSQVLPTGNATNPFQIEPLASNNHGCFFPHSPAHQGGEFICYAGIDNIYQFDGTNVVPIGDMPLDGRRKLGARKAILADLFAGNPASIYGYITTAINGQDFNAYWLAIPGISVWVYNLDEKNWTRFTYTKTISTMGRFTKAGIPRIIDLIGTIAQQLWTPLTLVSTNPFDGFLLGFNDGTPAFVDFTNYSELAWQVASGQLTFGDIRHQSTVKKFRIVIQDLGQVTFNISVTGIVYPNPSAILDGQNPPQPISTNNNQNSQTKTVTMGNGSGQVISRVVDFSVPGNYVIWNVSGAPNVAASFVEFTPIFNIGGEQRGA